MAGLAMSRLPMSRRGALSATAVGLAGLAVSGCSRGAEGTAGGSAPDGTYDGAQTAADTRFGAEWERHQLTVMSWPTELIWGEDVADVRADIAAVARAIAEFEPVTLIASPGDERDAARQVGSGVEVVPIAVDDLWARDTVPVFVEGPDGLRGVDLNFNGWGDKQDHDNDALVAPAVLEHLGIPRATTTVVSEGGSLETDGEGTLLITESSIVNDNRNPGMTREQLEAELIALLGVEAVIWFDGVYGEDITDAHIDSLVRFVAPGTVLLDIPADGSPPDVWSRSSDQARGVLTQARDAQGRGFEVVDLPQPDFSRIRGGGDDFLASYVNFYVANQAVFLPEFGDRRADRRAQSILGEHFPDREVVAVPIDTVASGGGGIHCATHDVPGSPG